MTAESLKALSEKLSVSQIEIHLVSLAINDLFNRLSYSLEMFRERLRVSNIFINADMPEIWSRL